jgi:hypothetical protein
MSLSDGFTKLPSRRASPMCNKGYKVRVLIGNRLVTAVEYARKYWDWEHVPDKVKV